MKAPFPYFGGKSQVADIVWSAIGASVSHYIEPFFGSGAVLLARPSYDPKEHTETVCDKDGFIANVWRSLQKAPDEVAKYCDWPVSHIDLCSRKRVLLANKDGLAQKLIEDDDYYDPKLAGYWIWCASCSIADVFSSMNKRPHLGNKGEGVHRVSVGGIPHLSDKGQGVHKCGLAMQADISTDVRGRYNDNIYRWFRQLSERLRYVRVVCGDWMKICGGNWQDKAWPDCGIFLDPPYSHDCGRMSSAYLEELECSKQVAEWAYERGQRENYRIVLAGYEGEHEWLEEKGWRVVEWSTKGGLANTARDNKQTRGKANRHRERLWLSPYCFKEYLW